MRTPLFVAAVVLVSSLPAAQATSTKLTAFDGSSSDKLGESVSIDGGTLLAGAWGAMSDQGAAYVYREVGGVWVQEAQLVAPDASAGSYTGWSVALEGDTAVVGREYDGTLGVWAHGSVDVFTRTGSTWTHRQKLVASDYGYNDHFGYSVDIDGDSLVVGARRQNGETGAVYVFSRAGGIWTQSAKLIASDGEGFDALGFDVAVDGGTVVAGAIGDDDQGDRAGAVYVWLEPPGGWSGGAPVSETVKLVAADGQPLDNYGSSVALDGLTLLVGAHADDDVAPTAGSAYAYVGAGPVWVLQQKLLASDGSNNAQFGATLALEGDLALVGASNEWHVTSGAGSAYLFARHGSAWFEQEKLIAFDADTSDNFGVSVDLSGTRLAAGAPNEDDKGSNAGAVYVFELPSLDASGGTPSVAAGGAVAFLLDAGPIQAQATYLMLGTFSGTAPGIQVDGLVLPLNFDPYTDLTLSAPNQGALADTLGALDAGGVAIATVTTPPGLPAGFLGAVAHHAGVVFDLTGPTAVVAFVTNPVSTTFGP